MGFGSVVQASDAPTILGVAWKDAPRHKFHAKEVKRIDGTGTIKCANQPCTVSKAIFLKPSMAGLSNALTMPFPVVPESTRRPSASKHCKKIPVVTAVTLGSCLVLIWLLMPFVLLPCLVLHLLTVRALWSFCTVSTKANWSVEGPWAFSYSVLQVRFSLGPSLPDFRVDVKKLQHDLRECLRH